MNTPIQSAAINKIVELHNFFCVTHNDVVFDQMNPTLVMVVNGEHKSRAFICTECHAKLPCLVMVRVHNAPELEVETANQD